MKLATENWEIPKARARLFVAWEALECPAILTILICGESRRARAKKPIISNVRGVENSHVRKEDNRIAAVYGI